MTTSSAFSRLLPRRHASSLPFSVRRRGERRHERGAHRAFGEQIADEVGNAERDDEGVHVVARAEDRGEHLIADEAEDAAGERRGAGQAGRTGKQRRARATSSAEFASHELVDGLAVHVLSGELAPSPPSSRGPCLWPTSRRSRRSRPRRRRRRRRDRRPAAGRLRGRRSRRLPCRRDPARPPFVNCSIESLRCLTSASTTCRASASSRSRPFSTLLFMNAALSIRSALRRAASCWRIASAIAVLTSSTRGISCRSTSGAAAGLAGTLAGRAAKPARSRDHARRGHGAKRVGRRLRGGCCGGCTGGGAVCGSTCGGIVPKMPGPACGPPVLPAAAGWPSGRACGCRQVVEDRRERGRQLHGAGLLPVVVVLLRLLHDAVQSARTAQAAAALTPTPDRGPRRLTSASR